MSLKQERMSLSKQLFAILVALTLILAAESYEDCHLHTTKTEPAGEIRNLEVHCVKNYNKKYSYYKFTWDSPKPSTTPVSGYCLFTWDKEHHCFQLDSETRSFIYNRTQPSGMKFVIAAQPLKRDKSGAIRLELKRAPKCNL